METELWRLSVDVRKTHVGGAPEIDVASSHFLLDRVLTHAVIDFHKLVTFSQLGPGYGHIRLTNVGVTEQGKERAYNTKSVTH